MLKIKITTGRTLPRFPTTSEMFLLKMTRWRYHLFNFLYTNIPIIGTLKIIKDYVNNVDQFISEAAMSQDKFLNLVYVVLSDTW